MNILEKCKELNFQGMQDLFTFLKVLYVMYINKLLVFDIHLIELSVYEYDFVIGSTN